MNDLSAFVEENENHPSSLKDCSRYTGEDRTKDGDERDGSEEGGWDRGTGRSTLINHVEISRHHYLTIKR